MQSMNWRGASGEAETHNEMRLELHPGEQKRGRDSWAERRGGMQEILEVAPRKLGD